MPKQWGYEEIIVNNDQYCGKRLVLLPNGYTSSIHYHALKTETFCVTFGEVHLELYRKVTTTDPTAINPKSLKLEKKLVLREGDVLTIPIFMPHRFWAKNGVGMFLEFSTPHMEDDSLRIVPSGPVPR